jgi:hypothetical protein
VIIKTVVNPKQAVEKLGLLEAALKPEELNKVVKSEAFRTLRHVAMATPVNWFGQVRRSWQAVKLAEASWLIVNQNPIMLFLEKGTRPHGPVVAKMLFIPLTRRAARAFAGAVSYPVASGVQFQAMYRRTVVGLERPRLIHEAYDTVDDAGNVIEGSRSRMAPVISFPGGKRSVKLVYGVDYMLSKHVAGIAAMNIARTEQKAARQRLMLALGTYLRSVLRG